MKYEGFKINKESVDKVFPKKDIDIFGYESPIQIAIGQMRMEQDNNVYRAIREYGIDVDKDELIKALQYDRNQYDKGFVNGYNHIVEIVGAIFEEIEEEIKLALKINKEEKDKLLNSFFSLSLLSSLNSKIELLQAASDFIAELKKEYTEGEGEG